MIMPIIRPNLIHAIESAVVQLHGTKLKISTRIDIKENLPNLPRLSDERILDILTTRVDIALTSEEVMEVLSDRQAAEGLAIVAAILESPELLDDYDVHLNAKRSREGIRLEIGITRKIRFHDRTGDFSKPTEEAKEVVKISVVTSKEKIKRPHAPKKKEESRPPIDIGEIRMADEYLDTSFAGGWIAQPCRPSDRDCWHRQIRAFGSVPDLTACGEFLQEQEAHETKIAGFVDHNLDKFSPLEKALSGPSPSEVSDEIQTSGECSEEWNNEADIPTLACTRAMVGRRRLGRDPVYNLNENLFGLLGSFPIAREYLSIKKAEEAAVTIYKTIWVAKWLEVVYERYQKNDLAFLEDALRKLSGYERVVLLAKVRSWYNERDMSSYKPLMSLLFEEYFIYLYPEAADRYGLPDFNRMPTRLWWATNWLGAVKRRGVSLADALRMLKCTKSGEAAIAALKGLTPYFKRTARYSALAEELERLL